jgi:hypothetical protein
MTICLVVQKDTLDNNKVKSVLKIIDETPQEFVDKLQEGHCFRYQLVAHTANNTGLFDKVINVISKHKTSYGKDWYELDHEALAKVVSLFLEHGDTVVNFKAIASILGFSLKLFPVVTKEVKITTKETKEVKEKETTKEDILTLVEKLEPKKKSKK